MTPTEAAKILRAHNEWRRGEGPQHDPAEIDEAIDCALAALCQPVRPKRPVSEDNADLTVAYMVGVYDERARKRKTPCAGIAGIVAEMRHHYPRDMSILAWALELEQVDPAGERLQDTILRCRVADAVRNWRSGIDDAQSALSQIDVALQARGG